MEEHSMNVSELKDLIRKIVERAKTLKDKYTDEVDARVNYACIFTHSDSEYDNLIELISSFGCIAKETPTGPMFHIEPLNTVAGDLIIFKVRKYDDQHKDLGDADFTVIDFELFKQKYLSNQGFKLISRPNVEMVELMNPEFEVRVYFSNPPADVQLGLAKKD
jgi:hypothetical protein